jgi:molybdopterin synthase catalytic subunit
VIKVQEEDFSLIDEITFLKKRCKNIGALSTFIGIVRDKREDEKLVSMTLEHYPGMTEKMLNKINTEALSRWDLLDTTIIHRYGKLLPGEQIVLVITASKHRKEAIDSCHFIIDWLKTKGPFWKYEKTIDKGYWVDAKSQDLDEELKWNN